MDSTEEEEVASPQVDEEIEEVIEEVIEEIDNSPQVEASEKRKFVMSKRRKIMVAVGAILLLLPLAAYLAIGWQIYVTLAHADPGYGDQEGNNPAQFNVTWDEHVALDTSIYFMDNYEDINISSRTEGITLSGWWVEVENATQPAPTVIIQHGIRSSKASYQTLMVAGMLNRNGFNVVMIDLRDHGMSTVEDGRVSIGTKEYIDVMSLVDWLIENKSIPEEKIGMVGNSMGAGTAAISFGQDTRIQAVVLDSGYLNLDVIVKEELERESYPPWLFNGALFSAWLFGGESLLDPSPTSAFENAGQRSIFIIHGTADDRVDSHHSEDMISLAEDLDVNASSWFVEDAGHVEVKLLHAEEYEQRLVDFFTATIV
ncbi:MAG: alpha/beta fold hydrolase [Euryarchaeota archaeon]|nr:alpha/beta fold hydrolase [Euryarchaeota archaeon]